MQYSVILFDFDGTLADSQAVVRHSMQVLGEKYNIPGTDLKKLKHNNGHKFLAKGKMLLHMEKIQKEFKELYASQIQDVHFYDGARDMLYQCADLGLPLVILSSNSEANIRRFFQLQDVQLPLTVCPSEGLFGKHKTIEKYLRTTRLSKSQALYVGDEVRDVKACNKAGIDIAFAQWGVDFDQDLSPYTLRTQLARPADLLPFLQQLG